MTLSELEELGEAEVRHRFERGDYCDRSEVSSIKRWLKRKEKEREFLAACERANISSALFASRSARRANLIATAAVIIAAIGAYEQIISIASRIAGVFHVFWP